MTLNQISVFLENRPGQLEMLTDCLAKHKINMRALSLAETSEFGIVRMIVDDVSAASALLSAEGMIHTVTRVLGVAIPDEPGGLHRVLHVLTESGINVEYMYAFLARKTADHAYMIFHVQDADGAVAALEKHQMVCLTQEDAANL